MPLALASKLKEAMTDRGVFETLEVPGFLQNGSDTHETYSLVTPATAVPV